MACKSNWLCLRKRESALRQQNARLLAESTQLAERAAQAQRQATDDRQRSAHAEVKATESEARHQTSLQELRIAQKEIEHHKTLCSDKMAELEKQLAVYKELNAAHNQKCTEYAHLEGRAGQPAEAVGRARPGSAKGAGAVTDAVQGIGE